MVNVGESFWRILCAFLATLLLSACTQQPAKPRVAVTLKPLNVVIITVDTLRADHLRCYGYSNIETPTMDALAQQGVLFENAVAQTPLTPPSHASIFTGQYPTVHGVRNTGGFVLPASARPLARILHEQGWDTAAFVSSAVLKKVIGFNSGFEVYDDQMPRQGKSRDVSEEPERLGGDTVDRALQWLGSRSSKPYLLWVHLYDPHMPYHPPGEFSQKYKTKPYDGEIAYADQQIGRLLDAVRKKSQPANTIVALLSDHGESLAEHGEFTHGVFLYDSTLRIAFLMTGPGVPAGLRVKQQVRSIDFLPTLLTMLGGNVPGNVQGTSLMPTFLGQSVATDVSYEETLYPKIAMGWAELRGIRTNRWKYIHAPKPELYDLVADPGEIDNVIAAHPAEVQKFEAQLKHVVGTSPERVRAQMLDESSMAQLHSLGYLSGFSPQEYDLNGQGPDPKDRLGVLKKIYVAESSPQMTQQHRIKLLQEAVEEDPKDPSLYHQLGGELEKAGRYGDAMHLYETALERGVDNGRLHSRIADLSLRAGNKDRAVVEYEKAAKFNPADLESQTNLGTAYLELGRLTDADRVFNWVLSIDSRNAEAHNGLGLIAVQNRNVNTAQTQFEQALKFNPDLVEAQLNLGLIYEIAGERARARQCFEAFLAKAPPKQYAATISKVKQELAALQQ